jgi:hypothetical protein
MFNLRVQNLGDIIVEEDQAKKADFLRLLIESEKQSSKLKLFILDISTFVNEYSESVTPIKFGGIAFTQGPSSVDPTGYQKLLPVFSYKDDSLGILHREKLFKGVKNIKSLRNIDNFAVKDPIDYASSYLSIDDPAFPGNSAGALAISPFIFHSRSVGLNSNAEQVFFYEQTGHSSNFFVPYNPNAGVDDSFSGLVDWFGEQLDYDSAAFFDIERVLHNTYISYRAKAN